MRPSDAARREIIAALDDSDMTLQQLCDATGMDYALVRRLVLSMVGTRVEPAGTTRTPQRNTVIIWASVARSKGDSERPPETGQRNRFSCTKR